MPSREGPARWQFGAPSTIVSKTVSRRKGGSRVRIPPPPLAIKSPGSRAFGDRSRLGRAYRETRLGGARSPSSPATRLTFAIAHQSRPCPRRAIATALPRGLDRADRHGVARGRPDGRHGGQVCARGSRPVAVRVDLSPRSAARCSGRVGRRPRAGALRRAAPQGRIGREALTAARRALVTGATGFVGGRLTGELAARSVPDEAPYVPPAGRVLASRSLAGHLDSVVLRRDRSQSDSRVVMETGRSTPARESPHARVLLLAGSRGDRRGQTPRAGKSAS
jgi:hypothetical protein